MNRKEAERLLKQQNGDFFVCEHHKDTGGWEPCCSCSDDGYCTEYLQDLIKE